MKTYYVIYHNNQGVHRFNVSLNPESFRNIPVESAIWNERVNAKNKDHAISIALEQRRKRNEQQ